MTKQESGRRCGLARAAAVRARGPRVRGLHAVTYAAPEVHGYLQDWIRLGYLDRFLQEIEAHSYKRGYNKRDERVRRLAKAHAARATEQAA